mgnify:CR=1 FL=1
MVPYVFELKFLTRKETIIINLIRYTEFGETIKASVIVISFAGNISHQYYWIGGKTVH